MNCTFSNKIDENNCDLYKAVPAQAVQDCYSQTADSNQLPLQSELEEITSTVTESDESVTIKLKDLHEYERASRTPLEETIENKSNVILNKMENYATSSSMPTRGSTPTALKFLQPKRKLLKPSQVISKDENEMDFATTTQEKSVIEEEVAKALPSVKALAKAFLMTTNKTQPENLWLQKARTLSQSSKRKSSSNLSLDPNNRLRQTNAEEDVTITSDLSSLETDSSSVHREADVKPTSFPDPLPVRQGDFKSNIAFFENLKNK